MLEVLLIDILRKEGILTDEQVSNLGSVNQLYSLLVNMKVIKPLLPEDREILTRTEAIMDAKVSFAQKINMIEILEEQVSDSSLKEVMQSLLKGARKLEKNL